MTQTYVQEKSRQALAVTQGDLAAAQKLLVAWSVRDQVLLLGLAKAHLKALANLALEQAARDMVKVERRDGAVPDELLTRLMNQVGQRQPATTTADDGAVPVLDPVRQAQTWQAIAQSFKKKD